LARESLDDSNSRRDVEGVVVSGQTNVSFLQTIWTDECINLGGLDSVRLLHSGTNLGLVGADVNNEYNRVVVLDHFHGAFSGQRIFDDLVIIELRLPRKGSARVSGLPTELQGVRAGEGNTSADLQETT
jgi:hypothetical protein